MVKIKATIHPISSGSENLETKATVTPFPLELLIHLG